MRDVFVLAVFVLLLLLYWGWVFLVEVGGMVWGGGGMGGGMGGGVWGGGGEKSFVTVFKSHQFSL